MLHLYSLCQLIFLDFKRPRIMMKGKSEKIVYGWLRIFNKINKIFELN